MNGTSRAFTPGGPCAGSPPRPRVLLDRAGRGHGVPGVRPLAVPPRLTVAIPTYNGARHLADALRGILAQEGVAFDLLISDDRSDDDTLAIVRDVAGDRARVLVNGE